MEITLDDVHFDIESMSSQTYGNITIIPIKTISTVSQDILTLKKGLDMGIVIVEECNPSTVNKVKVTNKAVTPLILVDGDEISGAMQNRIINTTTLVPPKATIEVSVSCTEHGRWQYHDEDYWGLGKKTVKNSFDSSDYIANSRTRTAKHQAIFEKRDFQSDVWASISNLECDISFKSKTSALNDSYENLKSQQDDYLKHFKLLDNQCGLIAVVNNEIKGIEFFYTPSIYRQYHEKILRSYVIDEIADERKGVENKSNDLEKIENKVRKVAEGISKSKFERSKGEGLGDNVRFSNKHGTGCALIYEDNIIHMPYFKNLDFKEMHHGDMAY